MHNSTTEIFDEIYSKANGQGTADAPGGGNDDFLKGYQSAQSQIQNVNSSQLQQTNQAYQASDNYGSTTSGDSQVNRDQANAVGNQQMGNTAEQSQASQDSLNNPSASVNNAEPDMTTREGRWAANKAAHENRIAAKERADAAKASSRNNPYSNGLTQEEYRVDKHGLHADPSLSPEKAKKKYERELIRSAKSGVRNPTVEYEQQKKADKEAEFEKRISQYSAGVQSKIRKKRDAKKAADVKAARAKRQAELQSPEMRAKIAARKEYDHKVVDDYGRTQAQIDKTKKRQRQARGQASAMRSINPRNQGFTGGQWS